MWNRRALAALVALSVAGCGAVRAADVCDGTRLALDASPDARGHLSLNRRMKDYEGADHVSVRATGPRGRICTAERTLAQANGG